jgi:hypothetical protein
MALLEGQPTATAPNIDCGSAEASTCGIPYLGEDCGPRSRPKSVLLSLSQLLSLLSVTLRLSILTTRVRSRPCPLTKRPGRPQVEYAPDLACRRLLHMLPHAFYSYPAETARQAIAVLCHLLTRYPSSKILLFPGEEGNFLLSHGKPKTPVTPVVCRSNKAELPGLADSRPTLRATSRRPDWRRACSRRWRKTPAAAAGKGESKTAG